jgi:hypothetical protein
VGWSRFRRRTAASSPVATDLPRIDQRGVPSHVCLSCGGNVLVVRAVFEDYAVAAWFLDAECACCGAPMTAPCPSDDPTAA